MPSKDCRNSLNVTFLRLQPLENRGTQHLRLSNVFPTLLSSLELYYIELERNTRI